MSVVQFDLAKWSVWAPEQASPDAPLPAPKLEFLPAMQRRRLSGLARICFHVAWQVIPQDTPCGMVFCSRHGETGRTLDMLYGIQREEPVSPTAFSHSVHNAIPALLSIARHDITEQVTIAQQGEDGLEAAFLEAAMMLASGNLAHVVVLCCDEPLPEMYHADEPRFAPFAWAAAFLLRLGTRWQLACTPPEAASERAATTMPASADNEQAYWPAPLLLANALDQGAEQFLRRTPLQQWQWKKQHA